MKLFEATLQGVALKYQAPALAAFLLPHRGGADARQQQHANFVGIGLLLEELGHAGDLDTKTELADGVLVEPRDRGNYTLIVIREVLRLASSVLQAGTNQFDLNISNYTNGMYVIAVQTELGGVTQKFTVYNKR